MTFPDLGPFGYNAVLPSATATAWATYISRSLDGYSGGTYAPGAAIVINGAGLTASTVAITGSISVASGAALSCVTGSEFSLLGGSASSFTMASGGSFEVDATSTFGGTLNIDGTTYLSSPVTAYANGRVKKKVRVVPDTPASYRGSYYDVFIVPATNTADRIYEIDSIGSEEGDVIRIHSECYDWLATFYDSSGPLICVVQNSSINHPETVDIYYNGSAWILCGRSMNG